MHHLQNELVYTTGLIQECYWESKCYLSELFIISFPLRISPIIVQSLDVDRYFPRLKSQTFFGHMCSGTSSVLFTSISPVDLMHRINHHGIWHSVSAWNNEKMQATNIYWIPVFWELKQASHSFCHEVDTQLVKWGRSLEVETGIKETKVKRKSSVRVQSKRVKMSASRNHEYLHCGGGLKKLPHWPWMIEGGRGQSRLGEWHW